MIEQQKWANHWSTRKEIDRLLANVTAERFRIQHILRYLPKGRVLEAGCGDGKYVFYLARLGYDVYGVDFVRDVIERDRLLSKKEGIGDSAKFFVMDVATLQFPDNYFDGYISMGVIEHSHDPTIPLREAHRTLKVGGIAFITVPNKLSPNSLVRFIRLKRGKESLLWQREYTRWQLRTFAVSVGFECIASFNCNVRDSLRSMLQMQSPKLGGLPNPFYYLRGIIYWLLARESVFSLIGYHSVFVGRK